MLLDEEPALAQMKTEEEPKAMKTLWGKDTSCSDWHTVDAECEVRTTELVKSSGSELPESEKSLKVEEQTDINRQKSLLTGVLKTSL